MHSGLILVVSLFLPLLSWADTICPSPNSKLTPPPSELAKLCSEVKLFQDQAVADGNDLQCIYNYALTSYGNGPKVPQAWLKVSSDPKSRTSPKEVAEDDSKRMGQVKLKVKSPEYVVEKAPWTGVEAYVINSSMGSIKVPGDLYYVKTSAGVRTVQLKVMNKVPRCVEKVVRYVVAH